MKRNSLSEQARKVLLNPVSLGLLLMLLFAVYNNRATNVRVAIAAQEESHASALQVLRPWTAVASTGTVDETSLNGFAFGSSQPSDFGFRPATPMLQLLARYNVTNTFDNNANPNIPNWHILELGAIAPLGSTVSASLFQIERCTGKVFPPPGAAPGAPLCTATIFNTPAASCRTCNFAGPVDFANFLYFVEVKLSRPNVNSQPRAFTLRVF
jgi:hypothetical protein